MTYSCLADYSVYVYYHKPLFKLYDKNIYMCKIKLEIYISDFDIK